MNQEEPSPQPAMDGERMSSSVPSEADSISSHTDTSSSARKPNAPTTRYVRSGIGGKGNYHKVDPTSHPSSSVRLSLVDRCKRPFRTGIGGAGNRTVMTTSHEGNSSSVLSPAEQVAMVQTQREQAAAAAAVGGYHHVGIGGTGNRAKRESTQTSPSESPLLASASTASLPKPEFQYSDQPLRVGAADRLAAKLFGIRR